MNAGNTAPVRAPETRLDQSAVTDGMVVFDPAEAVPPGRASAFD